VGLSALLYMVYGLGACLGPLAAGTLMRAWGPDVYFVFVSACAALLVVFIRERKVKGTHRSEDAPTQFVPMADTLQNSNVMAVLDPRVDPQRDISHDPVIDDPLAAPAAPEPAPASDTAPEPAPVRTASAGE
jgi:hypothetical protein